MRLLADLYSSKGEISKGFELAKAAHNLAPSDPHVAEILGRLAFANRDYRWSLSLLQDTTANQPNDPDAFYDLGRALYSLGSVKESEVAVQQALDIKSRFARREAASRFLESVYLGDDPQKAAEALTRLHSLLVEEPNNIPALVAQGEAHEQIGNAPEAIRDYEGVLSHYPDFKPVEKRLIVLYSKNPTNGNMVLDLANKAREAFPKDPEVAKACGIVIYQHGDYRRAEALLTDSASALSDDAEVTYYLGMAQYHLKEKSSRSTLEHALSLDLSSDLAAQVRHVLTELR